MKIYFEYLVTTKQGWNFDSTSNLLLPKFQKEEKQQSTDLNQLQELTEYFCYLDSSR